MTDHMGIAGRVDSEVVTDIGTRSTQVGGVDEAGSRRVQLRNERIAFEAAIRGRAPTVVRTIEGARSRGVVRRCSVAGYVGIGARVERYRTGRIGTDPSDEGR